MAATVALSSGERSPGLDLLPWIWRGYLILSPVLLRYYFGPTAGRQPRSAHDCPNTPWPLVRASSVARRPPAWRTREPWRRFRRLAARVQISHLDLQGLAAQAPSPSADGFLLSPRAAGPTGTKIPWPPRAPGPLEPLMCVGSKKCHRWVLL